MASYRRAIAFNPNLAEAYVNLGNALGEQGEQDEALTALRRAVDINPNLSEAHNNLGIIFRNLGKMKEAETAYRRVLDIDPGNSTARHMLAALTGETPETAPKQYVIDLFDEFSNRFDRHLLQRLEYKTPSLLRLALDSQIQGKARFRNAIDLGCGTGLAGQEFRNIADRLSGIDISPKMVDQAKGKRIYDDLRVGDFTDFLNTSGEQYDLITSADVFVYLGDLKPIFDSIQRCAAPEAYFVFSTEHFAGDGYILQQTGRYAHSQEYIRSLAEERSFAVEVYQQADIRKENESWVLGNLFVLKYTK